MRKNLVKNGPNVEYDHSAGAQRANYKAPFRSLNSHVRPISPFSPADLTQGASPITSFRPGTKYMSLFNIFCRYGHIPQRATFRWRVV